MLCSNRSSFPKVNCSNTQVINTKYNLKQRRFVKQVQHNRPQCMCFHLVRPLLRFIIPKNPYAPPYAPPQESGSMGTTTNVVFEKFLIGRIFIKLFYLMFSSGNDSCFTQFITLRLLNSKSLVRVRKTIYTLSTFT